MLDYGVALKLNNGKLMVKMLIRLLHVLISLNTPREHGYTASIVTQILIVLYQKKHDTPAWRMLKHDFTVFNEEVGEMAFSILARCVLGDSSQSRLEHLNEAYTLST